MGASLTMIDRQYGHFARDGREHAARLLDSLVAIEAGAAGWTLGGRCASGSSSKQQTESAAMQRLCRAL
jgi:hypothetical protein